MPKGEKREQETENLCEKTMTEKFPNMVEEIDIRNTENLGRTETSKQAESKEIHTKTHSHENTKD